ncbi:hypothetical protein DH2020_022062 [Rehmannia glutinosa]|uniref:Ubiquitin-activating enzyme E1 C-terminal domain-containing protein n=1 Tax=Rehmannia glutinosa TaxID=99300 RepID=A0ABR0WG11_REHGL
MGIRRIFGSLLHYMLPRKRQGEGEAVNEQDSEIVLKKHRISTSTDNKNTGETNSSGTSNLGVGNSNIKGSGSCGEPTITEMAFDDGKPRDIDEDLHSRQLAVYGRETMRRLFASNVLVSGMQGLGVEIAKNLILAGVKSVTLHDEGTVELWDMSSNFVFSEKDLGKNRALASIQKLQELNNAVAISTLTTKLNKEQLSDFQFSLPSALCIIFSVLWIYRFVMTLEDAGFDVAIIETGDSSFLERHYMSRFFIFPWAVVFTDINLESAIEFNEYCHNHEPPIAFIKTEVRGLFGSAFCDFGPEFTVFDVDGEEPHTGIIASISNDNPALVACVDDERLEFQDGDLVVFSEIRGMTELNDGKPRKIKMHVLTLSPLMKIQLLSEAINDPGDFLLSDFSKFDRPPLLHLAFQSLDKFVSELGRFPVAGSEEDAQRLISITSDINESLGDAKLDDINPKLLRHFAFGARAVLNPMAAMFGGIVGQEVVKACSGKFHPLFQFFYFDSVESLPTELLDPSDFRPLNSRYDAQISVFGSKLQKKLEDAKVFVVGSGALGCEFLKNLALMGVSCGKHGKLTITDDDVIEKSNLSRQFLFRDWNIGQPKSTVAASAASSINPLFHIEALQNRVGPETENVFSDTFWENLNVVVNALDNVNARLYVDQRCLYFQKPLLESGTLEFEGLLEKTPAEANAYLSNPNEYASAMRKAGDAQARDNLERVIECLDRERCESFQDCITWARLKFEDYFANRVKQLTFTFPEDAATSTGAPFWSAPKRFPRPLQFSVTDPSHLHFIMAASILRAETFGISVPDWAKHPKKLAEAVDKVILPDFQPKKDVKIVTDEKATSLATASVDDTAVINELLLKLDQCQKTLPTNFRMKPIQFEKIRGFDEYVPCGWQGGDDFEDDDTNYHMDLIAALANMRARNYSIPEVDKLKAKFIAGRIIPAIATSTAMATGLVCLELYKVINGSHKLEDYRNTFANLALPLFSMAEPVPPKVVKHQNMSWTVWDRWIIKDNPTLRELLQWLADKGLNAYSISFGSCLLYNSMFPRHKDRMDKKVVDLARDVAKVELPPYRDHLDVVVACEDDEDNDVDIPQISVYFR